MRDYESIFAVLIGISLAMGWCGTMLPPYRAATIHPAPAAPAIAPQIPGEAGQQAYHEAKRLRKDVRKLRGVLGEAEEKAP